MPSTIQKLIKRFPVAVMSISVLLFLGVQAVFSFCGQKTCLAFNHEGYDGWLPYKAEQTIIFVSGTDKDTLTLFSVERSEAIKISVGYGNRQCYSRAAFEGRFTRPNVDSTIGHFSANCQLEEDGTINYGVLRFRQMVLPWNNITDTGIDLSNANTAYSNFQSSLVLNGTAYANVQTIMPAIIDKNSSFSHLYIAKTRGVIGFQELPSGRLWIKQ